MFLMFYSIILILPLIIHTYTLYYTILYYTIQLYDHRGETWADFTHMETVNLAKRPGMYLYMGMYVDMFSVYMYIS